MNKKRMLAIVKLVTLLALFISGIIAIVLTLGASVAWITGLSLVKSSLAVVIATLLSVGTQAAVKDL